MTAAVELLAWWAATVGVWMLSLSAYSTHDLVVAVACGLPCGVMAVVARRAVRGGWRPPMDMLRWVVTLPGSVLVDAARVLSLPWRPRARSAAGAFREVSLHAIGDGPAATGRRALGQVLLSSTPGTYVVSIDPDSGAALVHGLTGQTAIERQVTR